MSTVSVGPAVSVVVATHDRCQMLGRMVEALEAQTEVGPFEAVVVDDGSTDETWPVLQRLADSSSFRLVVLRLEHNSGPAAARNAGWRAARGDVVVFTDDDCIPQPGWLRALLERISTADLVQGRTLPVPEREPDRGPFARSLWVHSEDGRYQTCNIAYRRDVLERLGGFDEGFRSLPFRGYNSPTYGEDTDLAWRAKEAGAVSVFEPSALVHHEVYSSSYLAHLRDMGRRVGLVRTVGRHPELRRHLHSRWFYQGSHPPALWAALGLGLIVSRPTSVRRWGTALLLGVPYVRYRLVVEPVPCRPRNRIPVIGMALLADLVEIGVLAGASARYRTLLL